MKSRIVNLNRNIPKKETKYELNSKTKNSLAVINGEITKFVRRIVEDNAKNPKLVSSRLEIKQNCWLISLYNAETNQTASKAWPMDDFVKMCSYKKIEFELNVAVKKLILIIEDKSNGATIFIN